MKNYNPSSLSVKLPKVWLSSYFSIHSAFSLLILKIAVVFDFKKEHFGSFLPLSIEHMMLEILTSSIAQCKCITHIYPVVNMDLWSGNCKIYTSASISCEIWQGSPKEHIICPLVTSSSSNPLTFIYY